MASTGKAPSAAPGSPTWAACTCDACRTTAAAACRSWSRVAVGFGPSPATMTRLLGILPCLRTKALRPTFPPNSPPASTAESSPPSALSTRAAGPSSAPPPAKMPIPSASQANASGGSSEIENSTADPSPPKSRITVFLQLFPHAHRQGSLVRQFHRGDVLDRDALRLEQRDLLRRRAPRRRANHDLTQLEHALRSQLGHHLLSKRLAMPRLAAVALDQRHRPDTADGEDLAARLPSGADDPHRSGFRTGHVFGRHSARRSGAHLPQPVGLDYRQQFAGVGAVEHADKPGLAARARIRF